MSLPVDWTGADAAQLAAGAIRPGVLLRIFAPRGTLRPIRLWSGVGELVIPGDDADPFVSVFAPYYGIGALTGIPVVNQLINGLAERADFTLSAVDMPAHLAELAGAGASEVRGAGVQLGVVVFDAEWQRIASPLWLWRGTADVLKVERTSGADGDVVRTLSLSVGSVFSGRKRPSPSYWTDPEQRRSFPDDRFFDRVALYYQGSTMVWPA